MKIGEYLATTVSAYKVYIYIYTYTSVLLIQGLSQVPVSEHLLLEIKQSYNPNNIHLSYLGHFSGLTNMYCSGNIHQSTVGNIFSKPSHFTSRPQVNRIMCSF